MPAHSTQKPRRTTARTARPARASAPPQRLADTKARILAAAARQFARHGFRRATIRSISADARVNLAAVNYHFRDKLSLYREVFRHTAQHAIRTYPNDLGLPPDPAPADRLRAFIHSFLLRILDPKQASIHGKLMSREMVDPTVVLDDIVHHIIRPSAQYLISIVRDLAPPHASQDQLELAAMSVVSQCLFQHQCRPVIQRLFPHRPADLAAVNSLAHHIFSFSLMAIRSLPAHPAAEPRP